MKKLNRTFGGMVSAMIVVFILILSATVSLGASAMTTKQKQTGQIAVYPLDGSDHGGFALKIEENTE